MPTALAATTQPVLVGHDQLETFNPTRPPAESTPVVTKASIGESLQTTPATAIPAAAATETSVGISDTVTVVPPQIYRLAFTRWNDGDSKHSLWLVDTDGSNEQYLLDYAASPSWSADGSSIVFLGEDGIAGGSGGVWRMSASGTGRTQLKQDNLARAVNLMPGGTAIAYDAQRGDFRIYFVDYYGTVLPVEILGEQPAWAPDGSRLVIRACRPDCGLWLDFHINPS